MHSLGPALDESPDLLLVIGHVQLNPFDGSAPGAFGSRCVRVRIYRVGLPYVSKLIGRRQSLWLDPRVSLPREGRRRAQAREAVRGPSASRPSGAAGWPTAGLMKQ